jgi:non-ribosomal peptide synthetase component E (peptide arylation enzyme)
VDIEQIKRKLAFDSQVEKYLAAGGRRATLVEWDFLNLHAQLRPDGEALIDTWEATPRRYTFRRTLELCNSVVVSLIAIGMRKGDVAFVQLPNIAELWYLRVAFSKIGIIEARIGENYREKEIAERLQALKPRLLIIPSQFRGFDYPAMYLEMFRSAHEPEHVFAVGEGVPQGMRPFSDLTNKKLGEDYSWGDLDALTPKPDENYVISFTGGTTGSPKSVLQSVFYAAGGAVGMQVIENGDVSTHDRILALAPLAGGTGSNMCYYAPVYAGASVLLMPRIDVEAALRLTEQEKVTIWAGIPTYAVRLLASPNLERYNLKSVRLWIGSGAKLPVEFAEKLYDMGIKTMNAYGVVDGSIACRTTIYDTREKMIETSGKPVRGLVIKIVDDCGNEAACGQKGEITGMSVRGGNIVDAEACDIVPPDGVDENGFFHTGDIGCVDEEGYLRVVDRKKDMILRGGQNIFPSEIEGLLLKHPSIAAAAVVGMPDRELGERTCAYIVPKPGKDVSYEAMITFLKGLHMASYKLPERLETIASLPLSHGGKYDKALLKADVAEKLKREGKI